MKRTTAEILREYGPFPGVDHVHGVSYDGQRVWLASGDKLSAFDPASGKTVRSIDVAARAGTAFDGQHLFQLDGDRIQKIDPETGRVLATIPAPGGASGLAWAEGTLWVGQDQDRKIHQVDPQTGAILRTIESNRFVTGVTWIDGELWHGTSEGGENDVRRVDPKTGEVLERLEMPPGVDVSGVESDGGDQFFCGGGSSGKVRAVRRPKGGSAAGRSSGPTHKAGTREEWRAARLELLAAEKELTRRSDELVRDRQELPWVRVDKEYRFETDEGSASLADLFRGRSQLLVYHFMFGPEFEAGCPTCSSIADGFDGSVVHLANHDVMLWAISRAPLEKLQAYKRRMSWSFPWASSAGSDFNFDFNVSFTEEQQRQGDIEYNYEREPVFEWRPGQEGGGEAAEAEFAAMSGTDVPTYHRERPGMSAFVLEDGTVYHTYSAYARGLDGLWGMYQWLDRAPKGRNETSVWWRRHDEYDMR